jgi:Ca-activated chloride channel family protein
MSDVFEEQTVTKVDEPKVVEISAPKQAELVIEAQEQVPISSSEEKGKQQEPVTTQQTVNVIPEVQSVVAGQSPEGQTAPKIINEGKEEEDQDTISQNVELITLKCTPSVSHIVKGVVNQIYVLFEIRAKQRPQQAKKERSPLNLANVLDRSGSMAGSKLENSKIAIKEVIRQIGSNDVTHLVTYDSTVQVVFKGGTKEIASVLSDSVDSIKTGGSTDLYAGLEAGFRITQGDESVVVPESGRKRSMSFKNLRDKVTSYFDKKKKISTGDAPSKRIFLFSDGQTNAGIQDNETIFKNVENMYKEGVIVTTFGIGSGYNEVLMRGIADSAKGNYFFIDTAENIKELVAKAFSNLLSNLASDALLKVRGSKENILKRIIGKPSEANVKGASLGDITEGNANEDELIHVLCEFEVKPQDMNEADILTFEFSFTPTDSKKRVVQTGTLKMPFTSDDKVVKENPDVTTAIQMALVNDMDKEVVRLLDENKIEEAIVQKQKAVTTLTETAKLDKTGIANKLLKHEKVTLTNMQNRNESAELMRKRNDYDSYMGENKKMSFM